MNHTESELLQRIVVMLQDAKEAQLLLKQEIHQAIDDAKTRDEKIRGEMMVMTGSFKSLEGAVEKLNGNVIVLGAAIEELERSERKVLSDVRQIRQEMEGLTQLCRTTFDQNASILENVTGTKGADRPQRTSRPSDPG